MAASCVPILAPRSALCCRGAAARRSPRAGGAAPPGAPPPGRRAGRAHAPPQPSLRPRPLSRPSEAAPHPHGSLFLQLDLHPREETRRTPLGGKPALHPRRARKALLARLVSRTQTICRVLGRKLGSSEATVKSSFCQITLGHRGVCYDMCPVPQ